MLWPSIRRVSVSALERVDTNQCSALTCPAHEGRTPGRLEGHPVCGGAGVMELPWVAPAKGSRTLRTAAAAATTATEGKWQRRSLLARTPSRGREQRDAAMWYARYEGQIVTTYSMYRGSPHEASAVVPPRQPQGRVLESKSRLMRRKPMPGTRRRRRRGARVCRKPRCACRLRTATCRRAARR